METVITLVPVPDAGRAHLIDALAQAGLPRTDIAADGRSFFAGEHGGLTVGYIGIEVYGRDALLRSLLVIESERGQGFGTALVAAGIAAAQAAGADRVWALTMTAVALLQRLGFQRVERESAPTAIRATTEFSSLCPRTAVCLARSATFPAEPSADQPV
jgi:N-acetylglutamate synthase-like GNAT family acetyltransferase